MKIIRKGFPTGTHPAAVVDYPNSPALALKKKDQMYSIENRNPGAGRQIVSKFSNFPKPFQSDPRGEGRVDGTRISGPMIGTHFPFLRAAVS